MQRHTDGGQILATYSWKATALLLPIFAVATLFLFGWYDALENPNDYFRHGIYMTYALIVGSVFYLIAMPTIIRFFRRIVFDDGRAMWMEDGDLIYLDPKFFKVPCVNVTAVVTVEEYSQSALSLTLSDGKKKVLPTSLLSAQPQVILQRVKEACSLQ